MGRRDVPRGGSAVGMVVTDLNEQPGTGRGYVARLKGRIERTRLRESGSSPVPPRKLGVLQAARRGPCGLPGGAIVGAPGAYDRPH
jgi:hypothetical protein